MLNKVYIWLFHIWLFSLWEKFKRGNVKKKTWSITNGISDNSSMYRGTIEPIEDDNLYLEWLLKPLMGLKSTDRGYSIFTNVVFSSWIFFLNICWILSIKICVLSYILSLQVNIAFSNGLWLLKNMACTMHGWNVNRKS